MTSHAKHVFIFAAGDLFKIGGLQRSYAMLTGHLLSKGHQVSLCGWVTPGQRNGEPLAYPLDDRVELYFIRNQTGAEHRAIARKLVEQAKPDVILIVNSSQKLLDLQYAVRGLGIPIVSSIRGSTEYCLRYLWPCKRVLELAFLGSDRCHVLMPSYKEPFPLAAKDIITVIPSQIQPATTFGAPDQPNDEGRFVILYSGRMSFEKRVGLLVEAFARLASDYPQWDLWLYGNGPELEDVKQQVQKLGLAQRVVFGQARNTDEMYQVYPKAHIKALPSEQEGCPMALREAMSHGIPVVAFAECSGTNEIVTDGKDGFLVEATDRVRCLQSGLKRMMDAPAERQRMGEAARETAGRFHPDIIHGQWEKLLLEAADNKAAKKLCDTLRRWFRHPVDYATAFVQRRRISRRYNLRHVLIINNPLYSFFAILRGHWAEYTQLYGRELFDPDFYFYENSEVLTSGIDPLLHYLQHGWKENTDPCPEFNAARYVQDHMNGVLDMCPLLHYYKEGRFNGARLVPSESDYYSKATASQKKELRAKRIQREEEEEVLRIKRSLLWKAVNLFAR